MPFDGKWHPGDYVMPPPVKTPFKEAEPELEPIETVALRRGQTRVTSKVESDDGTFFIKVEIMEVDPGAGINGPGMRTVRQEIVARGKRS